MTLPNRVHKRIAALKAHQPQALSWMWRRKGESTAQAKQQAGFSAEAAVIVLSWAGSSVNKGAAA